jgi:hypothetical protein
MGGDLTETQTHLAAAIEITGDRTADIVRVHMAFDQARKHASDKIVTGARRRPPCLTAQTVDWPGSRAIQRLRPLGLMTEYRVPARFFECISTENEEGKRRTRQEIITWILDNLDPIPRPNDGIIMPDAETGDPIWCRRLEYVMQ